MTALTWVLLAFSIIGLIFGFWQWMARRRTVQRLDNMLEQSISSGFTEEHFDETELSALETKFARFLRGSAHTQKTMETEQEAVKIDRTAFERYLDTGYFSVMEKEQPVIEVEAQRETDEAFAKEHLIPRESTFEIDGRRFVVDSVNLDFGSVSLQDVTFQNATGFPIFRSESIEFMRRLVEISEAPRSAELPAEPSVAEPKPELHNFHITDDHLGEGGAKAKFRMNMDAINLLKELEFDGRQATPEEQVILSKYVGWGGLADAFDETKDNWKNEFAELYATLSPEEYAAARGSTLNAHYTSPVVIKAIYEAVGNMGFETGNILEIILPSLIQSRGIIKKCAFAV